MKASKIGIRLIKKYEGFRNFPYFCPAGIATIGWGNTFYEDGTSVKITDPPIERGRANELLKGIISIYEDKVNVLVTSKLNQNQFDALVCFAYNQRSGAFERSTLLKRVNANPNDEDISYQFKRWNKARLNGVLTVLKGLKRRRSEEAYLYFKAQINNPFKHCENE